MPLTEQSYADRQQRGRNLQTAIASFSPAFAPAEPTLLPAAFLTFLETLDTLNTEVGSLSAQYSTGVQERMPMLADIKERAARVLAFVQSNSAWTAFVPSLKKYVDKIRGNRPKPPAAPTSGEDSGSAPVKKRNQGEQSLGDIEEHFERLIASLSAVPGYAPPAADLTIANLTLAADAFAAKNLALATLGNTLGMKQKARLEGYDGAGGLREKMKAIKAAVRAQYGTSSPEYGQVKGIGL